MLALVLLSAASTVRAAAQQPPSQFVTLTASHKHICPGRVITLTADYATSDGGKADALDFSIVWDARYLTLVKGEHAKLDECELGSYVFHRPTNAGDNREWVQLICADHRMRTSLSAKNTVAGRIPSVARLTLVAQPGMPAGSHTTIHVLSGHHKSSKYRLVPPEPLQLEAVHTGHNKCHEGQGQPTANCVVGPWNAWESCTATCGGGKQFQTRQVLQHPVGKRGRACPKLVRHRACHTRPCPRVIVHAASAKRTPAPTPPDRTYVGCHTPLGDFVHDGWVGAGAGADYCNLCSCHRGDYKCTQRKCGAVRGGSTRSKVCSHVSCVMRHEDTFYQVTYRPGELHGRYKSCSANKYDRSCACRCFARAAALQAGVWKDAWKHKAIAHTTTTTTPAATTTSTTTSTTTTSTTTSSQPTTTAITTPAPTPVPTFSRITLPAHRGSEVNLERDFENRAGEKLDAGLQDPLSGMVREVAKPPTTAAVDDEKTISIGAGLAPVLIPEEGEGTEVELETDFVEGNDDSVETIVTPNAV